MKLSQLTFTRFLAALGVVFLHFTTLSVAQFSPGLAKAMHYLNALVSYFFLLSGFILVVSSSAKHTQPSYREFWLNRFARVYPLYLFAFLLTLVSVLIPGNHNLPLVDGSFMKPALSSIFLIQAWIPDYAFYLNYPSWSLSVEALFYLAFPFLFRPISLLTTRNLLMLTVGSWLLNQGLHVYLKLIGLSAPFTNAFPLFHLTTFLMGICLGIVFMRHQVAISKYRHLITIGLFISSGISLSLIGSESPLVQHFEAGFFAPVFALVILYLCSRDNWLIRLFNRPLLIYLGEISYGIYILQAPVAYLIRHINKTYLHVNAALSLLMLIVALLIVATLCYEYIETPCRIRLRRLATYRFSSPVSSTISTDQIIP